MATYKATIYPAQGAVDLYGGFMDSGTGLDVTTCFTFSTAGLTTPHLFVTGDLLRLAKIPKGAVITDFLIQLVDTDSATSQELDLGLEVQDDNGLVAASTKGRGGTDVLSAAADSVQATGVPLECTCAAAVPAANGFDYLTLTAKTAGAGAGAGGTIKGWVRYNLRGSVR